jgi:pyridoxine/pyridoxamine 5'-phosphate oxidase
MEKITKEHIFAGFLGGALSLILVYGARRYMKNISVVKNETIPRPPMI